MLWNNMITIDLLSYSMRHIDVQVISDNDKFRFLGTYGYANTNLKHKTWELIDQLRVSSSLPWLIGGDLNEILHDNEKQGGSRRNPSYINNFRDCMSRSQLAYCKPSKGWYTWTRMGPNTPTIRERLDRFLANPFWVGNHPQFHVFSEFTAASDHCLLFMDTETRFSPSSIADEVVTAFRDIGPGKVPGIDGFPSSFFRLHWNTIGSDFTRLCLDLLHGSADMASINRTIIVLIPKVASPDYMRQFRPISLCMVIYKTVSKVLVNRMKSILPHYISPNQGAFVSGRSITDNILIAHELIHSLSSIGTGPYQGAAVKLDIEKAFDRIEWNFLRDVMFRLGFDSSWVCLILRCITTVSFTVRINGCLSQEFRPQRGLRQGDPLSPFLFLLCTQALSALLTVEQISGGLAGLCASRNGPRINHLLFADDSLIFI
ncbi:hypothetical protein GQ457_03G020580 [Hibiscus cannabinus]